MRDPKLWPVRAKAIPRVNPLLFLFLSPPPPLYLYLDARPSVVARARRSSSAASFASCRSRAFNRGEASRASSIRYKCKWKKKRKTMRIGLERCKRPHQLREEK